MSCCHCLLLGLELELVSLLVELRFAELALRREVESVHDRQDDELTD